MTVSKDIKKIITEVHPRPDQRHTMPYAPAINDEGPADILFLSGSAPSPLYHQHPHVPEEHQQQRGFLRKIDEAASGAGGDVLQQRRNRARVKIGDR